MDSLLPSSIKRVLVTGGAGFIGGAVSKESAILMGIKSFEWYVCKMLICLNDDLNINNEMDWKYL